MAPEVGKGVSGEKPPTRSQLVQVETKSRVEFKEITETLQKLISESGVLQGTCLVFVPHTTAAVLINENYDRGLQKDWDDFLSRLAPHDRGYHHDDGNCDSHLKAALIGNSKSLFIEEGRLVLGHWQGVFLCEFDGPRRREVRVKIVAD
jgi:secondary thiamine-phosphate synthase enzyme